MKAIYALYLHPESAQKAVDGLRATGVQDQDITILSSEPMEEFEFGQRDRATWMSWIAAGGAFTGMTIGYLLTSVTQQMWPINTGGMPIVSNFPNMIVIFELTMLGAVFASVLTLMVTAKIPGRAAPFYDPEISDGKILIGVANPKESALKDLERALQAAPGAVLKRLP